MAITISQSPNHHPSCARATKGTSHSVRVGMCAWGQRACSCSPCVQPCGGSYGFGPNSGKNLRDSMSAFSAGSVLSDIHDIHKKITFGHVAGDERSIMIPLRRYTPSATPKAAEAFPESPRTMGRSRSFGTGGFRSLGVIHQMSMIMEIPMTEMLFPLVLP